MKPDTKSTSSVAHETYSVRAGEYECIYNHVPLRGLAAASVTKDATAALGTARGRLGQSDGSDALE